MGAWGEIVDELYEYKNLGILKNYREKTILVSSL